MSHLPLCLINSSDLANPIRHLYCFEDICLADQDSDMDDIIEDNAGVHETEPKVCEHEIRDNTENTKVDLYDDGDVMTECSSHESMLTRAQLDQLFEDTDEDEDSEEDTKIKHRQRATMKDHSYAKDIKIKNLLLDWETDEETGCKVEPSCKENGPWRFLPTEPETTASPPSSPCATLPTHSAPPPSAEEDYVEMKSISIS